MTVSVGVGLCFVTSLSLVDSKPSMPAIVSNDYVYQMFSALGLQLCCDQPTNIVCNDIEYILVPIEKLQNRNGSLLVEKSIKNGRISLPRQNCIFKYISYSVPLFSLFLFIFNPLLPPHCNHKVCLCLLEASVERIY